jgi:hypothetical protein
MIVEVVFDLLFFMILIISSGLVLSWILNGLGLFRGFCLLISRCEGEG